MSLHNSSLDQKKPGKTARVCSDNHNNSAVFALCLAVNQTTQYLNQHDVKLLQSDNRQEITLLHIVQ
jgi:hypothetical protein